MRGNEHEPHFASRSGSREIFLLVAISTILDLMILIYYLSQGTSIVFQNIYYFTIVLAAYWYRWRGAIFTGVLTLAYLGLSIYFDQDLATITQAIIRAAFFVLSRWSSLTCPAG